MSDETKFLLISPDAAKASVDFIGTAKAELQKVAQRDQQFAEKLPGLVDSLVEAGVLNASLKEAKLETLQSDPLAVFEALNDLTKAAAERKPLGGPGEDKSASAQMSAGDVFDATLTGQMGRIE